MHYFCWYTWQSSSNTIVCPCLKCDRNVTIMCNNHDKWTDNQQFIIILLNVSFTCPNIYIYRGRSFNECDCSPIAPCPYSGETFRTDIFCFIIRIVTSISWLWYNMTSNNQHSEVVLDQKYSWARNIKIYSKRTAQNGVHYLLSDCIMRCGW